MLRGFESLTRHGDHSLIPPRQPGEARSERSHGGTNCQSDSDLPRIRLVAPIAQSAERLHGKEKVKGSIPFRGSGRGFFRFRRRGSSAGQSARLIIVRSRVRAPPPLPILDPTGRTSDETKRGKQPWQASLRTFAPRSLWPARSARSATTSPRRTVGTPPTVSASPSSALAAASTLSTARPAENRLAIAVTAALRPRSEPRRHDVGGASSSPRGRRLASEG